MYPFDLLVDDLNLQYDTNRPPLVDVMVLLQNLETRQRDDFHLEGLAVTDCSGAGGTSKFDLKFTFTELSGEIKAEIEYNPDLFKEATITHLQSNFQRIVRTLQTKKAPVLADFDLVTTAEESEELNGFLKTMESI
jgi:non-ribosomal peptide synthetase component F